MRNTPADGMVTGIGSINGERFEWPSRLISGAVVRRLGKVSSEDELLLARTDEPDRVIEPCDLVDLGNPAARDRVFGLAILGFALTEAVALYALVIAFIILFV